MWGFLNNMTDKKGEPKKEKKAEEKDCEICQGSGMEESGDKVCHECQGAGKVK